MRTTPIYVINELDEYEQRQSRILSELQVAALQNDLAEELQKRLALKFNGTDPISFAQEEAEISGKIIYITWLLDTHQACLEENARIANQTSN